MKKLLCLFALLVGLSTASFANNAPLAPAAPVALTASEQATPTVIEVKSREEAVALAGQLTAGKAAKVAVAQDVTVIVIEFEDGSILVIVIVS